MRTKFEFARVLGQHFGGRMTTQIIDHIGFFNEAFGPPEVVKSGCLKLLYWNFQRKDGAVGFHLLSPFHRTEKPRGAITVDLWVRGHRDQQFLSWVLSELGHVTNCDRPPRFLNAEKFVIVPA
jgi:hypothetical protein